MFACREGVRLATIRGFSKVEFETDSREVFEYITDVKRIRRVADKPADWIARQSKEEMCPENWLEMPPSSLVFIMDKDEIQNHIGWRLCNAYFA
ncbi:hypothetical protein DITRI_Ditri12bG0105400 [Diplodiscus trichospermus]